MFENINIKQKEKIKGAILCSIIGDIYGLKYEGVKPKYINTDKILEKTFFNMYSDDTEHLLIMLKNINKLENLNEFNSSFMKDLRKWFFTLPYGIGKATLKSIIKSFFTKKSGVVSQGNGALMRLGVLGLFLEENKIEEIVKSNCILTHNSSESVITSVVLSKILNYLLNNDLNQNKILEIMESYKLEEWDKFVQDIKNGLNNDTPVNEISKLWTKEYGAYGYTLVTLRLSVYAFLKNKENFKKGLKEIISCGGDTDTNAFVYGLISGTYNGTKIEEKYLNTVLEKIKIEELLDCVFNNKKQNFKMFYLKLFFRNICVFPLIFIEIIKRYFLHLIGIKI